MWRTEWDSALREHYNVPGGLSASQLAERFGTTKGIIIRRARNLGLAIDRHRSSSSPPKDRRPITADQSALYSGVAPVVPIANPPRPAKLSSRTMPVARPSSPWRQCQWIDGHTHSGVKCGAPTSNGSSWCATHRAIVFTARVAS